MIEKTEECAISLAQLAAVDANIDRRCAEERWENGPPGRKMVALKAESVNLYDADKFVIRPATVERRCCFVELFAAGPQRPTWFVSHFWGEPVKDFVACITRHSKDRCLGFDWKGEPAEPGTGKTNYQDGVYEISAPGFYWVRSQLPHHPLSRHTSSTILCRSAPTPTTSGTSRRQ